VLTGYGVRLLENDPLYPVYVQFERFRAAQYSRELSDKVWRGCVKIAEQGYWAGGPPPYGLQRLLLDEKREPLNVLQPGQRKGIQNQRVTLVEGPPEEVAIIRRIFEEFVVKGNSEYKIAEDLNRDGIPSPRGRRQLKYNTPEPSSNKIASADILPTAPKFTTILRRCVPRRVGYGA
jgi:hypothetical protein